MEETGFRADPHKMAAILRVKEASWTRAAARESRSPPDPTALVRCAPSSMCTQAQSELPLLDFAGVDGVAAVEVSDVVDLVALSLDEALESELLESDFFAGPPVEL